MLSYFDQVMLDACFCGGNGGYKSFPLQMHSIVFRWSFHKDEL